MAHYTYKYRLYPTKGQEVRLSSHFGCCRFVYNHFLEQRKNAYLKEGKTPNYYQQAAELTKLKAEKEWMYETNSQVLQFELKCLQTAYSKKMSETRKFLLKDVEYSVLAEVHEASVGFYIYKDDDADYLFTGFVKWDGCSNWDFENNKGTTHPLHFCSKENAVEFGTFLGKLYDWTAELIKVLTDEEIARR